MKVGLSYNPTNLTDDSLLFARQVGVSHVVVNTPDKSLMPHDDEGYWTYDDLLALKGRVERNGMRLEAIENFAPFFWHKILLGLPGREKQMDNLKRTIENMGRAGIPIMGYNFTIAGVSGRKQLPRLRGGVMSAVYRREDIPDFDKPLPNGYACGEQVDPNPPPGNQGFVDADTMWERLDYFLDGILPVCEEYGVRLAAHPDDPPVPVMRQVSRLLINTENFDRMLARHPSPACMLDFCQGTFSEMPYGSEYVYDAIDHFCKLKRIAYVHFRNVRGQLPEYYEEFLDTGDVDMLRAMKLYLDNGFDGLLSPDHIPATKCKEPWITGVAYAIGYIRAMLKTLNVDIDE